MALTYDARGNPILQYGVQDGSVSWLAQVLGWWGYTPSMSDVYDWQTAEAVAKFQADYGYGGDGVMTSETWDLVQALAEGRPPPNRVGDPTVGNLPSGPYSSGPNTPNVGTGSGGTTALSTANRDAMARLATTLTQYGLGDMTDWIRGKLLDGASDAEILLDLQQTPQFKARFPVIAARQAAGLTPVSVGDILNYEQSAREVMRKAGLTAPAFQTPEYLQGLMGKDVSVNELNDRVNEGLLRVTNAPPEVRDMFAKYFGVDGDSALAALFLDPAKAAPELEKMAMTSYVGGIGERYNVDIAAGIAREVADTGLSQAATWAGFQNLDQMQGLFNETIGETTDLTAAKEGISAVFGTHPGAANTLEMRRLSRVNQFKGGGGVAATDKGAVGLGAADG